MIGYAHLPSSLTKRLVVPAILGLIAVFWIAACTNGSSPAVSPKSSDSVAATVLPENSYTVGGRIVYGARGGYEASLRLAIAYAELPRCKGSTNSPGSTAALCSQQAVVDQLMRSRDIAREALGAAETIVRTPGIGNDVVQTTIVAADAALKAFATFSNRLTTVEKKP